MKKDNGANGREKLEKYKRRVSRRRLKRIKKLRLKELVIWELDGEEPEADMAGTDEAGNGRGNVRPAGTGAAGDGRQKAGETGKGKSGLRSAAWALAPIITAPALLLALYLGLAEYYKNGFSYGTWINGIYCTGKSVEEVDRELLADCSYQGITVYDRQGTPYLIGAEDIGYAFGFQESLQVYLQEQNPYLWGENLFAAKKRQLVPAVSYDGEKLEAALGEIPDYADLRTDKERSVEICRTADGYRLEDERKNVLDRRKTLEAVGEALLSLETEIDLAESGCYVDLPYSDEMERTLRLWEQIKEFQDCRIVYRFGEEEVPIDSSVASGWIALDENGDFLLDEQGRLLPEEEKMEEFIERLADEFDTLGGVRSFRTTRGETVTVEGGTYGNKIDREAEKEYLKQAFRERAEEVHEPAYLQKGWEEGRNDIGDTYIEVDMTGQMMYYYRDGRLEVETPIVTGNTGRRMGTPEGVNYVYGKARNRILKGPGYASHVNFWMPVKGNIGIHDAAWRSEYGGEIYKTGGSHGCINTPYDAMRKLYDMAEVGTPVVMFYSGGQ